MKPYLYIIICALLTVDVATAQDYSVKPLSINKKNSSEIAPFVLDSTLYFVSNRRNTAFVAYLNQNMELLYNWYSAPILSDSTVGEAVPFMPQLQKNRQNGPFIFSSDKATLLATQSQGTGSASNPAPMAILKYEGNNGNWQDATPLFTNFDQASMGQPTLSSDGSLLVFASTKPDGIGKTDLYISENTNGQWSEPVNLGATVNSAGNDVFPYLHPSGKLYFASDGLGGMGGLDVYYTQKQNGQWQTPVALPSPINSTADDFAMFAMANETNGYLASNRNGSDNIFWFKKLWPTFDVYQPQIDDNYCFTLFEDGLDQTDTLPIAYRWDFGDGLSAKGKEVDHCFPGPGKYRVTLNAVDTILKIDAKTVADYELDLVKTEQVYITAPDTIKIGVAQMFDATKTHILAFEPKEFYWDFGDGETAKGKTVTHTYKTKGIYTIKCGTVSDTDPTLKFCSTLEIAVE